MRLFIASVQKKRKEKKNSIYKYCEFSGSASIVFVIYRNSDCQRKHAYKCCEAVLHIKDHLFMKHVSVWIIFRGKSLLSWSNLGQHLNRKKINSIWYYFTHVTDLSRASRSFWQSRVKTEASHHTYWWLCAYSGWCQRWCHLVKVWLLTKPCLHITEYPQIIGRSPC